MKDEMEQLLVDWASNLRKACQRAPSVVSSVFVLEEPWQRGGERDWQHSHLQVGDGSGYGGRLL